MKKVRDAITAIVKITLWYWLTLLSFLCFMALYAEVDGGVNAITVVVNVGVVCVWSTIFALHNSKGQRFLRWWIDVTTGLVAWFVLPGLVLAAWCYLLKFWGVAEFLNAHLSTWPSYIGDLIGLGCILPLFSPMMLWLYRLSRYHFRETA